ncbi:MAG TPA: DEAD/DEAH box helicase family protein [Gemmatimonadales bacterium]|nr:DEAD/DEAH box helicase family protein [Gemmatimonadales bacterium]
MPREWQLRELDKVVGAIMRTGAATFSGAPGAGKTLFAGFVFDALREAGLVERLMVVVPRRGLAKQWMDALEVGCHLRLKPHSAQERPNQDGVVVTYQSLTERSADSLETHLIMAERIPTLLVLDEVHHLARDADSGHAAWARPIARLAGDVEAGQQGIAGILNLSGTLWRSERSERISTVRYTPPDADNRIRSIVDGEVTVQELIAVGQLRSIDLYRVDAHVQVADYADLSYIEGNLSDVDAKPARAAVAGLADINSWRTAFVASVLDKLEKAHRALNYHVKALIVAATQDQAEKFRDEVDRQMRERHLQPLAELAVSRNEDEAQITLDNFRAQKRVGVLCTVDMAGEGYDCPEIAVLGYASNKLTSLYVRQVTARAMRVTDRERQIGTVLPAIVVLPDSTELVKEFLRYMTPYLHEIRADEVSLRRPEREGDGELIWTPPLRRFNLEAVQVGDETVTVSFHDGTSENVATDIAATLAVHFKAANLPEIYWPRASVATQRTIGDLLQRRPFDFRPDEDKQTRREPSLEEQCKLVQDQLAERGRWWAKHGDTPPGQFNYMVNDRAGIPNGKRAVASLDRLQRALQIAEQHIRDYKNTKSIR